MPIWHDASNRLSRAASRAFSNCFQPSARNSISSTAFGFWGLGMSTPRKIKRYSEGTFRIGKGGTYIHGLCHPDFATRFARIITEFVHLEDCMITVLAVLLGDSDTTTAGYVYRSIVSPRGRKELMERLLTLSPQNTQCGPEYDAIISEFWSLNLERNNYAHGQWYTDSHRGEVWLTVFDEHGWGLGAGSGATSHNRGTRQATRPNKRPCHEDYGRCGP